MIGRTVVCFLKSPLYSFSQAGESFQPRDSVSLPKDIVQVRAEVLKEKGSGLLLRVHAIGAEGEMLEQLSTRFPPALSEIFVPFAKIDYLLTLQANPLP